MAARAWQVAGAAVVCGAIGCTAWRLSEERPQIFKVDEDVQLRIADCLPDATIATGTPISVEPQNGARLDVESVAALEVPLPDLAVSAPQRVTLGINTELVLKKSVGDFEIRAPDVDLILRKLDGATLHAKTVAVFSPTTAGNYHVRADTNVKPTAVAKGEETHLTYAANVTVGKLADSFFEATLAQPLKARPIPLKSAPFATLERTAAAHSLLRVTGQSDSLATATSGTHDADVLSACISADEHQKVWTSATAMIGATPGTFSVDIPAEVKKSILSSDYVWVAVSTRDGKSVLLGGLNLISQPLAAICSLGMTIALLAFLMWRKGLRRQSLNLEARWLSGLFVGPDDDPSLSLLQMFIWTVITVWGMLYVFLVVGSLLTVTATMMALLGIAGSSSVMARWIAAANGGSTSAGSATTSPSPAPAGVPASAPSPSIADFWKMLSTNGRFDLLKLQMFAFTVVIAIFVVSRILQVAAFPDLDANTLLLMGVSQSVYISSKLSALTPLAKAQGIKADLELARTEEKRLTGVVADATTDRDKKAQELSQVPPADTAGIKLAKDAFDQANATLTAQQALIAQTQARQVQLASDYDQALEALGLKRI